MLFMHSLKCAEIRKLLKLVPVNMVIKKVDKNGWNMCGTKKMFTTKAQQDDKSVTNGIVKHHRKNL